MKYSKSLRLITGVWGRCDTVLFFGRSSQFCWRLTSAAQDWMNIIILSGRESFLLRSLIMWCSSANLGTQNENMLMRGYCYCEITHRSPGLYQLSVRI